MAFKCALLCLFGVSPLLADELPIASTFLQVNRQLAPATRQDISLRSGRSKNRTLRPISSRPTLHGVGIESPLPAKRNNSTLQDESSNSFFNGRGNDSPVRAENHSLTLLVGGPAQPHIVFILADDLGWNGVGYHNKELRTPTIDDLAVRGVKLEAHYAYKSCAPGRAALLTGRYPFKSEATRHNFPPFTKDGVDLRYKMLPQALKDAGYSTHMIGKWHQGFYMPDYTPGYRGFDSFFGFLGGGEDHFNQKAFAKCANKPIRDLVEVPVGSQDPVPVKDDRLGQYNDMTFTNAAIEIIDGHNSSKPLFMYLSLQNTHFPIEAPDDMIANWNFDLKLHSTYNAMIDSVDHTVAEVAAALARKKMWDNTLFVFSSDNGACVKSGGSNAPFKGGKGSDWEGGIRTPTFVSGGAVPPRARGTVLQDIVSIADWYATFADLAGAEVDNGGLSPSDSINQWPLIAGETHDSPRTEIVIDHWKFDSSADESDHGALRQGPWKLMVGKHGGASWFGEFSPNETYKQENKKVHMCQVGRPCLFDVLGDAGEHNDIAAEHPDVVELMMKRWRELSSEHHPLGTEMPTDGDGACAAFAKVGDFMLPWVPSGTPIELPLPGDAKQPSLYSSTVARVDPGDVDYDSPELIY